MSGRSKSYKDSLHAALRSRDEAAAYLDVALEESQADFLVALMNVLESGNLAETARQCGVDRAHLYRMLAVDGNPTLNSLTRVLATKGLRLSIQIAMPERIAPESVEVQLSRTAG